MLIATRSDRVKLVLHDQQGEIVTAKMVSENGEESEPTFIGSIFNFCPESRWEFTPEGEKLLFSDS